MNRLGKSALAHAFGGHNVSCTKLGAAGGTSSRAAKGHARQSVTTPLSTESRRRGREELPEQTLLYPSALSGERPTATVNTENAPNLQAQNALSPEVSCKRSSRGSTSDYLVTNQGVKISNLAGRNWFEQRVVMRVSSNRR
jgi:hypothetical protein